jgi:UV DNA damage endonuclease
MIKRLGFACKYIDRPDQINNIKSTDAVKALNTSTTTVRWLNEHRDQAEDRLWSLAKHNIEAARRLVERVGSLDEQLRMVRLGSDLLPVYTEPTWRYFWQQPDVRHYAERAFMEVGELARGLDVRLSFHPGQFVVLASDNPDIIDRSIDEFEYHATMAAWMGYGQKFQDLKINVHISGRAGPEGIRRVLSRLSPEARNCITIENEEMKHGLDDCLSIGDVVPIVLDLHHHWIREGEYISPADDRVQRVIDSWRGRRPTCHFSTSREDLLLDHCSHTRPDMSLLLSQGYKKSKLRAHSDFYWNTAVNDWALTFWDNFDIMCESKAKNLASRELYEHANTV